MTSGKYIRTKEIKEKISRTLTGRKLSEKNKEKMKRNKKGMLGKNHSNKTKEKISKSKKGCTKKGGYSFGKGKNNPNWNNGSSFKPYSIDWTITLKKAIRERDKYTCQICGKEGFSVHHIDYNKKNCNSDNLIILCSSCHTKTNHNRTKWIKFFKEVISHVMD